MAERRKSGSKRSSAPPPKPTAPPPDERGFPYQSRYTVKPEFWDRVLDSIPPWGDEIAAIVLIVFGIISFLSLFDVSSNATISTAWSNALTSLFGYGAFIVSGGILLLGVLILLPKIGITIRFPTRRVLALEVGFLALLALLHLAGGEEEWRALARAGMGGGIIGWGLSAAVAGLFSTLFAVFVYGVVLAVSIAVVIGLRQHHLTGVLQRIAEGLREAAQQMSQRRARTARRRERRPTPQPRTETPPPTDPVIVSASTPSRSNEIRRVRPNLDNIPPSQRQAIVYSEDLYEEDTARPGRIAMPPAPNNHIVRDFNAVGELLPRKRKTDPQMAQRPDGRIKRYFTIENMTEQRKVARREAHLPSLDLLRDVEMNLPDEEEINTNVVLIENTLLEFDIDVDIVEVKAGPTVTRYAVQPFKERTKEGGETVLERTRINRIASLAGDLSLSLAAKRLRLETPVPGQSYVGIEVPNRRPSMVTLRSVYESKQFHDLMQKKRSPLLIPLGRDVAGEPMAADIGQMPHLLIAGTTGSGKSVAIAASATALILNPGPDVLKLVMLDPKMVELSRFNGLPHLIGPVETDQERIIDVLRWCTREMDRRYKLLEEHAARNIDTFNARLSRRQQDERLPYIVILIDEIGDLMMSHPEETERSITRLAQMARAVGMHLIVATQRPSVDVITGLIKANFPTRMSFAVASGIDSRVILDTGGAETLLGQGDMLFLASDAAGPRRIQGCFVSDDEVRAIVGYWKTWYAEQVNEGRLQHVRVGPWERGVTRREILAETDPMLEEAIALVISEGEASASLIQRRMGLGYPRAARIIDMLYELRIIGPPEAGGRSRRVLIKPGQDPFKDEIDKRSQGG